MSGSVLYAFTVWIVLAAFYLFFAGQLSPSEVIAGVPAATLAGAAAVLLHRTTSRRVRLRAPWLRLVLRPIAALFRDAFRVGGVLLSALWRRPDGPTGLITRQPFRQGGNQPDDAGRRGLVTLGASLAPNGYVLCIPDDQDVLVMHRLAPAASDPDPDPDEKEWPL